jgi:hypothetical protein
MTRGTAKPRVWRAPIALNLVCAVGLAAALVSDGAGDVAAWFALALPVLVSVRYAIRSKNPPEAR